MSDQDQQKGFIVKLNVKDFAPEEVIIQSDGRFVAITGEHEEKLDDRGYIARHFVHRFLLPDFVDAEAVETSLSEDGILTVSAPNKPEMIEPPPEKDLEESTPNEPEIIESPPEKDEPESAPNTPEKFEQPPEKDSTQNAQ